MLRSSMPICADCNAPDAPWASINRGVAVCDECCGVHRSLGRHVSQIKHLKKGFWNSQQLAMHQQLLNQSANSIWEHCILDVSQNKQGRRKPNPRDPVFPTKADFIRSKYQFLKFVNKAKDSDGRGLDDINKQLHASVRTADLKTSLRLLSLGADPNFFHHEKGTAPLHVAAQTGQSLQVELLLIYGGDPGVFDHNGRAPSDHAKKEGHTDLHDRLIEVQYEMTDKFAFYLCGRKPDHRNKQHFIIPEMADSCLDLSELAKAAKSKLQALPNHLFEELAMDVYDEVDRRENEAIWMESQNMSNLVSDKQHVPFLPVNPEYSATRNQGRQKLARFNKREFATLIIDILSDARRRQQGMISPNSTMSPVTKESKPVSTNRIVAGVGQQQPMSQPRVTKSHSIISDDEPIYDAVCSDEDYASIGDNQSMQDEKIDSQENEQISMRTNPEPMSTEQVLFSYPSGGAAAVNQTSPDEPVGIEQYMGVKLALDESQATIHRMTTTNAELKKEVAMLQSMVQKLMNDNSRLLSMLESRGVGGSADVVNGEEGATASQVAARPASMYETRDHQKHWNKKHREDKQKEKDYASAESVKSHKSGGSGESKTSSTCSVQSQHRLEQTFSLEADYDNANTQQPLSSRSSSASQRSSSRSTSSSNMTPTDSHQGLSSITEAADPAMTAPPVSQLPPALAEEDETHDAAQQLEQEEAPHLPSQDDVVRKTEKITKKIQELLKNATESRTERYMDCASRIFAAVTDMINLFPENLSNEHIQSSLKQLTSGAHSLCEQCSKPPPDLSSHTDQRLHTQQVIQCAYNIAQAAKQLVMCFE